MQASRIQEARREALWFVDLATKLINQSDIESKLYGSADRGALRRLSLDLGRSLAEMRKP